MKKIKSEALWIIALVLSVGFLWCLNRDRLSSAHWALPVEYVSDLHGGDALSALAAIQASSEWNQLPLGSKTVDRLGAPFRANWNDFPTSEEFPIFLMGVLARLFGLFQASNLTLMLLHITSALAFYFCCRWMKWQRLWACVGAILFGFTYYHFYRGLGHSFMALTYTVPLAVTACWLVGGSRRMEWRDEFCWFCLAVGVVMGVSNPYNLNMYCQLLAIALVLQFFTRRRKQNLQIGAASLALAMLAFVVMNLDTIFYQLSHGKNPDPMERNYYESELFALKPMELFVPPATHHVDLLATLGRFYSAILLSRGEVFSPYLGVVAVAALIWIAAEAIRFALKRPRRRFPIHGLQSIWILFYSVNGGLNCVFALGGLTIFRAANRFSVFLSAISLLFLVSRLSILSRKWQPMTHLAVAAGLLLVGLYDQLPRATPGNESQINASYVESDHRFTEKMEAALPPGAMVFQLPVMVFPESLARNQMLPYEFFRPYLHSKKLRFSFGDDKGRPRDNWQWEVEKMPAPQMIAALEKYGFAAIYLNRRAFPDRAEGLLKQLAAAGKTQVIEDEMGEQVCVTLTPSPAPELPPSAHELAVTFRRNWQKPEGTPPDRQAWSQGDAEISFYNPEKQFTSCRLKFAIGSLNRRRVTMQMGGREIWSGQLNAGQAVPVEILVDAKSGNNLVEFRTDEPPAAPPGQPRPAVAFVVINLRITPNAAGGK